MTPVLDEAAIRRFLTGSPWGSLVRVVETTESTNSDALAWAEEGAPEGAVVVADHQTAGRGRRGRMWLSRPGEALLFSVVLRPPADRIPLLSTAVGVGACEAIRDLTSLSVMLKWPNDLMVGDRKVAGILIETRLSERSSAVAIAGLGVNAYGDGAEMPPEIARRATSIAAEMRRAGVGDPPARERLLGAIAAGVARRYAELHDGGDDEIVTTAESLSCLLGRDVVARLPSGKTVGGIVTGLARSGALEIETAAGYRAVDAGEVELVRLFESGTS